MSVRTVGLEHREGGQRPAPLAADTIVNANTFGIYNTSGYLENFAAAADIIFAGVIFDFRDGTGGLDGDFLVSVRHKGDFKVLSDSSEFALTDIGTEVFATSITKVSKSDPGNSVVVGKIVRFIDASTVEIEIDDAVAVPPVPPFAE